MALAFDGSVGFGQTTASSINGSLTTTAAGDVLIVFALTNSTFPSAVSDSSGLTWTLRESYAGTNRVSEYWAVAPTAGARTITITCASSQYMAGIAFGISGANTTSPFDTNASLPGTANAAYVSVSTTAANTIVFGAYFTGNIGGGNDPGPGWTFIAGGTHGLAEYQIVSSAQTGLSLTLSIGTSGITGVGDAIVQASSGTHITLAQATLTWAGTPPGINAKTQLTLTQNPWIWTGNAPGVNAKTMVSLPQRAWAWTATPLVINAKTLLTLTQQSWAWAGTAIGVQNRMLVALAQQAWTWAGTALAVDAKQMVTLAQASWTWLGRVPPQFASRGVGIVHGMVRGLVHGLVRGIR